MSLTLGFTVAEVVKKGLTTVEDIEALKEKRKNKRPKLTDEQIAIFLIACSNCQDFTEETIESNIALKNSGSNIFRNRNLKNETLRKVSETLNFSVMPEKYEDSVIFLLSFNDNNYKNYCQESHFKLYFMVIDSIVYDDPPRDGIIIIDAKGYSLMHITTLRLSLLKTYSEYFNSGIPLLIKAIHFINCSHAISCCFNVVRPFIKSEKLQKIHFHNACNNLSETLSIPPKYLPKEYGGELKGIRYYHNNHG
ncbi:hypothetical protein RN001_011319 [Aquatica leii]|uniref:CRAL-TRIO domain-containing protein n=1 Tax=Aquatica leii TaxID=1421715 RepID=A0AAN7P904_9COLE|nr:hypothetical protein RN001_011319 [Aquatica leii]